MGREPKGPTTTLHGAESRPWAKSGSWTLVRRLISGARSGIRTRVTASKGRDDGPGYTIRAASLAASVLPMKITTVYSSALTSIGASPFHQFQAKILSPIIAIRAIPKRNSLSMNHSITASTLSP